MFNKLVKYLKNDEYLISISTDFIHIFNYKLIKNITSKKIELSLEDKTILLDGDNFIIEKMEKKEMIVRGKVTNLEIK